MDALRLQNRITRGLGIAARKTGQMFEVFRPDGSVRPLAPRNLVVRLCASFSPGASGDGLGAAYAQALWQGLYDAAYTQDGDYLVGPGDVFFVARQRPTEHVQCVLTNRVISLVRPQPAKIGDYSGFFSIPGEPLLVDWPGNVAEAGGHPGSGRAGEMRFGSWTLLLPTLPIIPQVADVVSDDNGGSYSVFSAEQNGSGWRLQLRQVGA